MDWYELRYADFSLSEDQQAVQRLFRDFFRAEVPTTRVRAAEPLGFDQKLWHQLCALGAASMALPAALGGAGAGLVELVLVAQEYGAALAPVPLIEHAVATRLLASAGNGNSDLLGSVLAGDRIVTMLPQATGGAGRHLVPAGAVARDVIAFDGQQLTLISQATSPPAVPNQGSAPVAWWDLSLGERRVLSDGGRALSLFTQARAEWRLMTAAALVGLADQALSLAVQFATTRQTMGVAIGSLQGVAFPLADVAIGIAGARNLSLKAAWYCDNEPQERPDLVPAAFAYAAEVASRGVVTSQHMQGGLGFTVEADASLYFLRAKGWSLLGGDPADSVLEVGDVMALSSPDIQASDFGQQHRSHPIAEAGLNFSRALLDAAQLQFLAEVREFVGEHVTEELLEQDRVTGDLFSEELHLALGRKGWVMPTWPPSRGGAGLDAVRGRILSLELSRAGAPTAILNMTRRVAGTVHAFGSPELAADVLPGVADGSVRFCLGFTEPDGGSDIAAAKVRAIRDGDDWIINGAKMFTSIAQYCQYVFLLTRTDPDLPKHKGMTMFLVPLDSPGVEIQALYTYGGERTNAVYYGDVRVPDRYRLGEVNAGWEVLRGPLDDEHGFGDDLAARTLKDLSPGTWYVRALGRALDGALAWARASRRPDGSHPIDDPRVRQRLGHVAVDIEAALVTPGLLGRVRCSDVLVQHAADLMDLVGAASVVAHPSGDAVADGVIEFTHRFAQASGTQGGTVEVFRTMIAQHDLHLPRPQYPGSKVFLHSGLPRDAGVQNSQ